MVKDFYSIRLTWAYWPEAWLLKAGSPLSTSRDLWTTYKASWNNLWQGNSWYLCPRWENVPGTLLIFSFPSEAYGPCPMQEDSQNLGLAENRGCFDTEGQIPPTRSRMKNPHQHVTSKQTRYEWILVQHSTVLKFGVYCPTACIVIAMTGQIRAPHKLETVLSPGIYSVASE